MIIKRGNQTFEGVTEKEGKIVCQKCENPKAKAQVVMHMDGKEFFSWQYECECGNAILVTTKRIGEDRILWAAQG